MKSDELTTLAATLVSLGIVFGSDRIVGYPFIGAGVLLSIISAVKAREKKGQAATSERGRIHEN